MADRQDSAVRPSKDFNDCAEPDSAAGVNIWNLAGYFTVNQTATEQRAGCLAKAQSADGRRSKTADEAIRQAYADLAKSWVALAESIPTKDETQPH
jgi:hypothetical protein